MSDVFDSYNEIFEIEMDGWCYGLEKYPGEIFPGLIHGVLRELQPTFITAIQHHYKFDILEISAKFSKAAKYLVHEKEICFSILAQFPPPGTLSEDGHFLKASIRSENLL